MTWDKYKEQLQQNLEQGIAKQRLQLEKLVHDQAAGNPNIVPPGTMRPVCLEASRCGKWIGCGADSGFAVFEWPAIEAAADGAELSPRFQFENEPSEITRDGMTMKMPCRTLAVTFDEANQQLLAGCQDGKVKTINLQTGVDGVVLSLPEPMGFIQLELSSDQRALSYVVCDTDDQNRPIAFQIWDYRKLTVEKSK